MSGHMNWITSGKLAGTCAAQVWYHMVAGEGRCMAERVQWSWEPRRPR